MPQLHDGRREAVGASTSELVDALPEDAKSLGYLGCPNEVAGVDRVGHGRTVGGIEGTLDR